MTQRLKQFFENTAVFRFLQNRRYKRQAAKRQHKQLTQWESRGRVGAAPHTVKQGNLKDHARRYHLGVFVETGTHHGDMVAAMKDLFGEIYSIELSNDFFEKAKKRFEFDRHVKIIHGDSGKELGKITAQLTQPALFWLDGHFSGGVTAKGESDTPIYQELQHILNATRLAHVIVIDDAHCFGNDPAYPTVDAIREFVRSKREIVQFTVKDDSISIVLTA